MNDIISSRTPEGDWTHCPLCEAPVCLEPSLPTSDAPCPRCGALLWFYAHPAAPGCFDALEIERLRVIVRGRMSELLGVDERRINDDTPLVFNDLGSDSLDTVELVMALEEEFDIHVSDEEAESIRTVADFVAYLQRRQSRGDEGREGASGSP